MRARLKPLVIWLLLIGILFAIPLGKADSGDSDGNWWAVSYTTYETTYEEILHEYLKRINGYKTKNFRRNDLFSDIMFWDGPEDTNLKRQITEVKNRVGYVRFDINQDGIDELIILGTGGTIYEVFTIDEGKVRELIRGGGKYSCHLMNNGNFYRYGVGGGPFCSHEIWQMNGTGKVTFVDGYHTDEAPFSSDPGAVEFYWYHSNDGGMRINTAKSTRVKASVGEQWVKEQDAKIIRKRFVPFVSYEKYQDNPWDIAVLTVDGKSTGSSTIRIRKQPKQNAKVVATKKVGTYVVILGQEDGYYKVRVDKKEGYVKEEFLTVIMEAGDAPEV